MAYGFDDDKSKVEIANYDGSFDAYIDLLTDHWVGQYTNTVNYTYTAPADGYVIVMRTSNAESTSVVSAGARDASLINGMWPSIAMQGDSGEKHMFVKKGTNIRVSATVPLSQYTGNVGAQFRPYKIV